MQQWLNFLYGYYRLLTLLFVTLHRCQETERCGSTRGSRTPFIWPFTNKRKDTVAGKVQSAYEWTMWVSAQIRFKYCQAPTGSSPRPANHTSGTGPGENLYGLAASRTVLITRCLDNRVLKNQSHLPNIYYIGIYSLFPFCGEEIYSSAM